MYGSLWNEETLDTVFVKRCIWNEYNHGLLTCIILSLVITNSVSHLFIYLSGYVQLHLSSPKHVGIHGPIDNHISLEWCKDPCGSRLLALYLLNSHICRSSNCYNYRLNDFLLLHYMYWLQDPIQDSATAAQNLLSMNHLLTFGWQQPPWAPRGLAPVSMCGSQGLHGTSWLGSIEKFLWD
jgi:hypothetical protein